MCIECERLRSVCLAAADRLVEARGNLARYRAPEASDEFHELWTACQRALQELDHCRDEMARHTAIHEPAIESSEMAAG